MELEVLRFQEHSEPATQELIGELRLRPGQKEPAGQGPQLPSEAPPWIRRLKFMNSVCPHAGISTPKDGTFSLLAKMELGTICVE